LTLNYDLIVVGAGVSGSEAAYACAQAGLATLLVTTSLDTIYMLHDSVVLTPPPGTLMAELHAKLAEEGYVGSLAWHRAAKGVLERQAGLRLLQANAVALLTEGKAIRGVATWEGVDWRAPRVALCVGSFLQARLTIGSLTEAAGRLSEMAYDDLYLNLQALSFAFVPERLELPGSCPYRVAYQRFAPHRWDPASFRLQPIAGLYAAGVCAAGYLPLEAAARHGRQLAATLIQG
jgi:tRNA U34 5-carboxymethylaminomethyl modifying enzyme MnmG/GidA